MRSSKANFTLQGTGLSNIEAIVISRVFIRIPVRMSQEEQILETTFSLQFKIPIIPKQINHRLYVSCYGADGEITSGSSGIVISGHIKDFVKIETIS